MTSPTRRRPTIRDVARLAGVSATTVSFVLNDAVSAVGIPEVTKARVRSAASRIGYRPNATARLLRTHRSHTIGFITDSVASAPYAGQIISGAQSEAWSRDHILVIVNTGNDASLLDSAVRELLERQVDGFVYAAEYHHEVRLPDAFAEVPCVLVDCFEPSGRFPSVVPDEVGGGRAATEALLRGGHRRIGFINLNEGIPATIGRLQGYRDALAAAGVPYDPSLVSYGVGEATEGYRRAILLLEAPDPPTALFCGNDRAAMGAYDAIKERGLRIPDDIAVVGFDNQEIIAKGLRPPLASVALPHSEMGVWALAKVLEGNTGEPPQKHLMPCSYVPRESV